MGIIKLWPANSLDLNLLDYRIWGKLHERVYRNRIRDVDLLKITPDRTSSSAMAERSRELYQRFQMGGQFEAIID